MIIEEKVKKWVDFGEISVGDCFRIIRSTGLASSPNDVYIKTSNSSEYSDVTNYNALNLSMLENIFFECDFKVLPLKTKLIVED